MFHSSVTKGVRLVEDCNMLHRYLPGMQTVYDGEHTRIMDISMQHCSLYQCTYVGSTADVELCELED